MLPKPFLIPLLLVAASALAQDTVIRQYQVRLLTPIGSESKHGDKFAARVLGPTGKHRAGELPHNTVVHGTVRRVRPVGLGLKRERATLELDFHGCALPSGDPLDCNAILLDLDNARERVTKPNTVQGIVAASHPHSWFSGLWLRPRLALFGRSTIGLTGASGMLQARVFAGPFAAAGMVGARTLLFRLPDPEIHLPSGTDLILEIAAAPALGPVHNLPSLDLPEDAADSLQTSPAEVAQFDGQKTADLINVAFFCTREELEQAFTAAGWTAAKPLNTRTFAKTYSAFASMNTYKAAPVSPLTYEGRAPDAVFQKSFNTLAKRHHIRLWNATLPTGELVWLGAATHDIGIAFDWVKLSLTHRVDLRIDRERNILLNDFADAQCIDSLRLLDRPALKSDRESNSPRITDGDLAVARLRGCTASEIVDPPRGKPNKLRLLTRRIVLEARHYITRGNPYYYAVRAARSNPFKRSTPPGDDQ
ncbi:hypothetical protein F183_A53050 [Bryobacterales bacterium F-183]|nr:hypothetical protein F183_A53050 [Bryobacterales bacterium F-183]